MNRTVKTLLTITGIAAILYYLNEKKALSQIKATIRNITFINGRLQLVFFIQNPSILEVNLSSIIGDIKLNGLTIATVSGLNQQTIPANSSTNISVTVSLDPVGAITFGAQYWRARAANKHLLIDFNGTMRANGLVVPISQTTQVL